MAMGRLQRYGPGAVLISLQVAVCEDTPALLDRLVTAIEALPLPGIRELVRGYVTLLVEFHDAEFCTEAAQREIEACVVALDLDNLPKTDASVVQIPACYDGPDLARVAAHTGLTVAEVVERHAAVLYTVHFLGFSPGFPYLSGLDPGLATPRLETPRPRVPPGSIGIGGSQTGIYSVASPGGWNLIGRTAFRLFDPNATTEERLFGLKPGMRVQFVPAGSLDSPPPARLMLTEVDPLIPVFRIVRRGAGTGLQDAGRLGWRRFGVPASGALDPVAMHWANLLVGNLPDAAVLEFCLGGQQLEVLRTTPVALGGADLQAVVEEQGTGKSVAIAPWQCVRVEAGSMIRFRQSKRGVWGYLAIPGGFAGRAQLGSVSANVRADLGQHYTDGDEVLGARPFEPVWMKHLARRRVAESAIPDESSHEPIRVWPGPQWELFTTEQREQFFGQPWTVSHRSDRVGYRLEGQPLGGDRAEMLSEPALPGSMQILPSGLPIVTLHDGPTVTGYPRLGLVEERDLRRLVQTRAGEVVRFVELRDDETDE